MVNIEMKDPSDELNKLLFLDCKDYNKYHLIVNKKYSNYKPAIFYSALSRGYKTVTFEDLDDSIIYQLKESSNDN